MYGLESASELQTPPILTTDFLYLRLIGDRSIEQKDFGRIQIDRVLEMQKWADNIKAVQDERIKLAIVTANNHYAGFGPGTANVFRNMLGLQKQVGGYRKRPRTRSKSPV